MKMHSTYKIPNSNTFFHANNWPQVLDLVWLHEDASLPLKIDISFSIANPASDHRELSLLCHNRGSHSNAPSLSTTYLPSRSDEELDLVLFVLNGTAQWSKGSVEHCASMHIRLFNEAWSCFAKIGPIDGWFNKWWNDDCTQAKFTYNNHPTHHNHVSFQAACKTAKKAYFASKLKDMIKHCKPWLGMWWIKDHPIPKVLQICSVEGQTINELQPMFEAFQQQFQPTLDGQTNLNHPFLDALPSKPSQPFALFSLTELRKALATCSLASAPGPSHMSWSLLKLFLTDDAFQEQFLQLPNDIIQTGVWPLAFKQSVTVIIPKPHKDNYMQVKNFRLIALLECSGKLVSKLIATQLQSDAVHFNLVHPLQFGGLKYCSTVDAGFFLTEYITKVRNAGRTTSALTLDVAQFFHP